MELSSEELAFFKDIFAEPSSECQLNEQKHQLSVQTTIPSNLKKVLGNSKLTLLAEISHYQLWFPVSLSISSQGEFLPELGIPEIIDVQGHQRSWRVTTLDNVSLINLCQNKEVEILSLSGTGVTFKAKGISKDVHTLGNSALEMRLPDHESVKLAIDPVRSDDDIVAAKFKNIEQGRESLRKFLYHSHKKQYSDLYQDIIL